MAARGSCRRRSGGRARRSRRRSPARGRASTNSTVRGFLYDAMRARHHSMISSASTVSPSATTTIAFTACTHVSSGTPITAHSATAGCERDRVLDLGRVDVLGRRLEHPALGRDERERTVGLVAAEVVRVVPAVAGTLGVELGAIPVAVHHRRAAHRDLADLAGGHLVVVLVDDCGSARAATAGRACPMPAPEEVERRHAHHLGLAVTARVRGPTADVSGCTIASNAGLPRYPRNVERSRPSSALAATTASTIGPTRNPLVHPNVAIARHIASPSERRDEHVGAADRRTRRGSA